MTFDKDDIESSVFDALWDAFGDQVQLSSGSGTIDICDKSGKHLGSVDIWSDADEEERPKDEEASAFLRGAIDEYGQILEKNGAANKVSDEGAQCK